MKYEDVIKRLGTFGKYQRRLMIIAFLPAIYNAFGAPVSNFLLGDQHHRCKLPDMENDTYEIQNDHHLQIINESIPIDSEGKYKQCVILVNGTEEKCSNWVYDTSVFTLTVNSQFDLVCDDKMWHSHATSTYFFGYVGGALSMGPLGDIRGRRFVVCLMLTLQFLINIAMPFSPSVLAFCVLRFFDGYCGISYYHAAFIIGMELVGPSERLIAGTAILLVYAFGEFVLVGLAYIIRSWKWLQLTMAIPMAIPIIFWWPRILPESPRWLISRGRTEEAMQILRRAAKVNNVKLPDNITSLLIDKDEGFYIIMKELFHSRKIILRWFIVICNWFVISFIYYGLTVSVGKLGGNLFFNFSIAVLVEGLGYSLCFLLDLTGRKRLHLTIVYGACITCLASLYPIFHGSDSLDWLVIMLAMAGRLLISAGFGEIFIYTGELFPTVVRSFVMGICSVGARVGSSISPYMYTLTDGKWGKALPLIIYAVLTLTVATMSIKLPETRRRRLLEKMKDAENEEKPEKDGKTLTRTEFDDDSDEAAELSPL